MPEILLIQEEIRQWEADVYLESGATACAAVPSGAPTGS